MSRDLEQAARQVRAAGRRGDTVLAHINPEEAALLRRLGGSGTLNPRTGLPEFSWSGEGDTDYSGLGGGIGHAPDSWGGGWGEPGSSGSDKDRTGFAPGRNPELGGGLGRQTQHNMIEETWGGGFWGDLGRGARDALFGLFGLSLTPSIDQKTGLFGQRLGLDPLGALAVGAGLFGVSAKATLAAFDAFGPKGAMATALALDPKTVSALSALAGRPLSIDLGFQPSVRDPSAAGAVGFGSPGEGGLAGLLAPAAPRSAPKSPLAPVAPLSTVRSTIRGVGRAKGPAGAATDLLAPAAPDDPLEPVRSGLLAPRR